MTVYYKATRPDGTDFRTGTVDYGTALATGEAITHPVPGWIDASRYLSVSVEPAETLIGGNWPCRLFTVEPVGEVRETKDYEHKRAVHGLHVVREIEPWLALGPQGEAVSDFIKSIASNVTSKAAAGAAARAAARAAAWDAAQAAAQAAAWDAARAAAWTAAWAAAWDAARAAAWTAAWAAEAIMVKDLITPDQFDALMRPWNTLTGQDN